MSRNSLELRDRFLVHASDAILETAICEARSRGCGLMLRRRINPGFGLTLDEAAAEYADGVTEGRSAEPIMSADDLARWFEVTYATGPSDDLDVEAGEIFMSTDEVADVDLASCRFA